jgi:hypothetical protein
MLGKIFKIAQNKNATMRGVISLFTSITQPYKICSGLKQFVSHTSRLGAPCFGLYLHNIG